MRFKFFIVVSVGFATLGISADSIQDRTTDDDLKIAMDGYCVVSLFKPTKWIVGSQQFSSDFEGHRYLFATEKKKLAFDREPQKYAPVFGGQDPIELVENGRHIQGTRQFGCRFHNAPKGYCCVYLFSSDENRKKFDANTSYYVERFKNFRPIDEPKAKDDEKQQESASSTIIR